MKRIRQLDQSAKRRNAAMRERYAARGLAYVQVLIPREMREQYLRRAERDRAKFEHSAGTGPGRGEDAR